MQNAIDYDRFCKRCVNYRFDLKRGIVCGLTDQKPDFEGDCPDFVQEPVSSKSEPQQRKSIQFGAKVMSSEMKGTLRKWGIGLIILGLLHLLLADIFFAAWGIMIVLLGIANLSVQRRGMFIANGVALLFVGLLNIAGALQSAAWFWFGFGLFQLVWGAAEITKFRHYAGVQIKDESKIAEESVHDGDSAVKKEAKNAEFGLASFWIFVATMFVFVGSILSAVIMADPETGFLDDASLVAQTINLLINASIFASLVGIALGIAGALQKDRRRILAILGIVGNTIMTIGMLLVFLPV